MGHYIAEQRDRLDMRIARLRGDILNLIDMIRLEGFRDPDAIASVLRQAIDCDNQAKEPRP
jgi:hypothetical protein